MEDYSNPFVPKLAATEAREIIRDVKRINAELSFAQRQSLIKSCRDLDARRYFATGQMILRSKYWSDAEKIALLGTRLSDLQGFKYGKHVQRLLDTIRWQGADFVRRMNAFFDWKDQIVDDGTRQLIEIDRSIANGLSKQVRVYRGFNVPVQSSIRDKNVRRWLRQETGRGVYFTLSPKIALEFACLQKSSLAKIFLRNGRLKQQQREIVEGKIAVAEYKVPRDKIILYQHASRLWESESICKPSDVSLFNYKFYGFDYFVMALEGYKRKLRLLRKTQAVSRLCGLRRSKRYLVADRRDTRP